MPFANLTNVLRSIQMPCHQYEWLAIAYETVEKTMRIYAFLANFMRMFLIFATPMNDRECLRMSGGHLVIIANCIRKPIRHCVRAALRIFILSLTSELLGVVLRFCTGSDLYSGPICVTFVHTTGLKGRFVSCTCRPVLETPVSYNSFNEFSTEFKTQSTATLGTRFT